MQQNAAAATLLPGARHLPCGIGEQHRERGLMAAVPGLGCVLNLRRTYPAGSITEAWAAQPGKIRGRPLPGAVVPLARRRGQAGGRGVVSPKLTGGCAP